MENQLNRTSSKISKNRTTETSIRVNNNFYEILIDEFVKFVKIT